MAVHGGCGNPKAVLSPGSGQCRAEEARHRVLYLSPASWDVSRQTGTFPGIKVESGYATRNLMIQFLLPESQISLWDPYWSAVALRKSMPGHIPSMWQGHR